MQPIQEGKFQIVRRYSCNERKSSPLVGGTFAKKKYLIAGMSKLNPKTLKKKKKKKKKKCFFSGLNRN
jgi:hypothetical protein